MFCPTCGQEQISDETRFCSRCGLLLTEILRVAGNGGNLPENQNSNKTKNDSPRTRGIKHGAFFILLCLFIIPLIIAFSVINDIPPAVSIMFAFFTIGAGILRIVYALMFQPESQKEQISEGNFVQNLFAKKKSGEKSLPPAQSIPVSVYESPKQGNWRDTNDLIPTTVTESTTKLLRED